MAARGGQTRIGGIVIDILGNSVGFQKELKNVDRMAARFGKSFEREWESVNKSLRSTASQVFSVKTAFLSLAGAAGMGSLVKNTLDYADAVSDASDALGLSTKAYQEISFAAGQAGIGQDKFTASFSKFVQLAEGYSSGDKSDVFTRLGISAQEAGGDVEALFNLVVQQLDKIPTGNERLALIGELFGKKVATQWAATLGGGAQGLAEMRAQAEQLGLVLDDKSIRELGRLGDQLDAIQAKFQIAFAEGLIEGMTGKTGELTDLLKDPEVLSSLDELGAGFKSLGDEIGKLPERVRGLLDELDKLREYEGIAKILAAAWTGGKIGATVGGTFGKRARSQGAVGGFLVGGFVEAARQQQMRDNQAALDRLAEIGPPSPFGAIGVPPLLALPAPSVGVPPLLARPAVKAPGDGRPLGTVTPEEAEKKAKAAEKAAKSAQKAQERIDQFVASLEAEVAGLEMETAALGLSAEAQQEAAIQRDLLNTLTDKGIQLGSQEAQQVEDAIRTKAKLANEKGVRELMDTLDAEAAATREQIAALGMLTEARVREQVIASSEAAARAKGIVLSETEIAQIREKAGEIGKLAALQEDAENARQGFEDAARILTNGFTAAIMSGESLSDVLDNLIQQLADLALQRLIFDPLVNAAGTAGSSFWSSVVGAGAKSASVDSVAKAMAVDAPSVAAFDAAAQARAMPNDSVAHAPEFNVYVQAPQGHTASVGKKQNSSGGMDLDIIVEQLEQKMTQNTLRGRGFTPMFRAMGVTRTGMSG